MLLKLSPSEIHFTQDSICPFFSDGRKLTETFSQLFNRSLTPDDIPDLHVMVYGGNYYVVSGNRRLYLYRKLEEVGLVKRVDVIVDKFKSYRFDRMNTSVDGGVSVYVRKGKWVENEIEKKINNYKNTMKASRRSRNRPVQHVAPSYRSSGIHHPETSLSAGTQSDQKTHSASKYIVSPSLNPPSGISYGYQDHIKGQVKTTKNNFVKDEIVHKKPRKPHHVTTKATYLHDDEAEQRDFRHTTAVSRSLAFFDDINRQAAIASSQPRQEHQFPSHQSNISDNANPGCCCVIS